MRARIALALLVASAALAGCLAATDPAPVSESSGPATTGATPSTTNGTSQGSLPSDPSLPAPFSVAGSPNHATIVRNGSFTFYQSCIPIGCFTGDFEEGLDLSPELPVDVPAHVNVTLTYESDVGTYVGLDLAVDGAEVYDLDITDADGQKVWMDAVVARTSPDDQVVAQAQGFYPDDGSSDYTMRAQVGAHAGIVTPRVPTAVDVPAEAQGFTLGFADARGSFQATVWDPADQFVGHYTVSADPAEPDNVTVELGPDRKPGKYVVLVRDVELPPDHVHSRDTPHHHHGVVARPLAPVAEPGMEALALRTEEGGSHYAGSGETVTWEPHLTPAPLQAGLVATASSGSVNPGTLSGSLLSPSGEVLSFDGEGILYDGNGYRWTSPVGHPALDDGTYTATFHNEGGTRLEVTHFAAFYER